MSEARTVSGLTLEKPLPLDAQSSLEEEDAGQMPAAEQCKDELDSDSGRARLPDPCWLLPAAWLTRNHGL